jgi:hypothetical protein
MAKIRDKGYGIGDKNRSLYRVFIYPLPLYPIPRVHLLPLWRFHS